MEGCALCSKSRYFMYTPDPQKPIPPKFAQWDLENFRSMSRLTLGVSAVNTPYSSREPNKSVIVNRQCRVKN